MKPNQKPKRWLFGQPKTERYLDYIYTYLPIYLEPTANKRLHWGAVKKIYDLQEQWIKSALNGQMCDAKLPATITLTRVSPRELDFDNLVTAFKHVRDVIAALLIPGLRPGRADSDDRLTWKYLQKKDKPKEYAVQIEIRWK